MKFRPTIDLSTKPTKITKRYSRREVMNYSVPGNHLFKNVKTGEMIYVCNSVNSVIR